MNKTHKPVRMGFSGLPALQAALTVLSKWIPALHFITNTSSSSTAHFIHHSASIQYL